MDYENISRNGLYWILRYGSKNDGGWSEAVSDGEWMPDHNDVDEIIRDLRSIKELREVLCDLLSDAENEYEESERLRAADGWDADEEPASFASARELIAKTEG